MRDNATAVAQHASSEAHAALASQATSADVSKDDVASPTDEAIAQATLAKTPSTQTVSLAASNTKAGPAYLYPNPTLTSGAVLTTDASTICVPGYASSVRDVSIATKKQVYAEYGVSYPQALGAYEVDHFIPLEIGGSNDINNLWVEPASPTPGFHQKDQFENFEHGQVCNGTISASEAQSRMVSDWYLYWEEEIEGATATTSAPVPSGPTPVPQATTADASATYYTSSYHTATYWYPASCSGLAPFEQSVSRGLSNTRGSVSEISWPQRESWVLTVPVPSWSRTAPSRRKRRNSLVSMASSFVDGNMLRLRLQETLGRVGGSQTSGAYRMRRRKLVWNVDVVTKCQG